MFGAFKTPAFEGIAFYKQPPLLVLTERSVDHV
jgi:hypothetical protein